MKKILLLSMFFYVLCVPHIHYADSSDDWYNRPLGNNEDSAQTSSDAQKNNKNKQKNNQWYKKPAVKYAVGAIAAAALAIYGIQRYSAAPIALPSEQPQVEDKADITTNKDSVDVSVNVTENTQESSNVDTKNVVNTNTIDENDTANNKSTVMQPVAKGIIVTGGLGVLGYMVYYVHAFLQNSL